ncbi:beta-lactamase/transpeptidase-like protein [Zopfia rhizophila CBS 207.26]|uniref:Beta-lactamase/transpeptidase-like protein n=1 Tax=Zopfia rhizophila CBS 207.26 TaxID=1314779 RepID=A0A6A6EAJ2_9PEZI|nr:beta-lactamase/transpeptidase-like protein [Zopfia rhizophila CBS 207.26]
MSRTLITLSAIYLLSTLPSAASLCPIYGPVYPPPKNVKSSNLIKDALQNLTESLNAGFATGNSSHGPVVSSGANAIQIFSLDDEDDKPLFEYYHDGTTLSNSTGVRKVDGDSIFLIGSVSKLVTVYMFLAELGDGYWDDPVSKHIPELKNRTKSHENPIDFTAWDQVTLGALAGQVGGVTRDLVDLGAFEVTGVAFGFPPLEPSELPKCVLTTNLSCDRKGFFDALDDRQPTWAPNTTPIYSNTAFMILAYALESITGKSYNDILKSTLVKPLGLTGTSTTKPDDSRGAIPINTTVSSWNRDFGDGASMGGIYASSNDLSKIGRSILNSTLLAGNTTGAWLKPTAFTSSIQGAVGRPWEIFRAPQSGVNRVVDIYAKAGDIGLYHTFLAVVPDYNIGFAAAVGGAGHHAWYDGLIYDILFPALEAAAREQADAAYAGTYAATNGLNSSLILTTDATKLGLGIKTWISNGTVMTDVLSGIAGGTPVSEDNLRVYPTNLERETANGTEIAWRVTFEPETGFHDFGPFSACGTWFNIDALTHGHYSFDSLLFTLGEDGRAKTVNQRAFKIELERKD